MKKINSHERIRRTLHIDGKLVSTEDIAACDTQNTPLSQIENTAARLEYLFNNGETSLDNLADSLPSEAATAVHVVSLRVEHYIDPAPKAAKHVTQP